LGEASASDAGAASAEAADSGNEGGSSSVGGEEIIAGAGAGEERSGVPHVGVGRCCGECNRGGVGVSENAGVRVCGRDDQVGRGSMHSGGERHRSSSTPMPLNSSTSQRLFATFLIRFAGSGVGANGDSSVEYLGGEVSGPVGGSAAKASRSGCEAAAA
jgi:hypothetical protein